MEFDSVRFSNFVNAFGSEAGSSALNQVVDGVVATYDTGGINTINETRDLLESYKLEPFSPASLDSTVGLAETASFSSPVDYLKDANFADASLYQASVKELEDPNFSFVPSFSSFLNDTFRDDGIAPYLQEPFDPESMIFCAEQSQAFRNMQAVMQEFIDLSAQIDDSRL